MCNPNKNSDNWTREEIQRLKDLRIGFYRYKRNELTELVKYFKGGGSPWSVSEYEHPMKLAPRTATKICKASMEGMLDWLVPADINDFEEAPPTNNFLEEEWPVGYLSTTKQTLRGLDSCRWSTDQQQNVGNEFGLDLGKGYAIAEVEFLQGMSHQWDFPKRWRLSLSDQNGVIIEIVEGEGFIQHRLDSPSIVRYIDVGILEARLPSDRPPSSCWAIDNIRLSPNRIEGGLS